MQQIGTLITDAQEAVMRRSYEQIISMDVAYLRLVEMSWWKEEIERFLHDERFYGSTFDAMVFAAQIKEDLQKLTEPLTAIIRKIEDRLDPVD